MKKIASIEKLIKLYKTDYKKLTDFEIISLAIQTQRNQILESGLNTSSNNNYPSALEAIAIQLGFSQAPSSSIIDALENISQEINKD